MLVNQVTPVMRAVYRVMQGDESIGKQHESHTLWAES